MCLLGLKRQQQYQPQNTNAQGNQHLASDSQNYQQPAHASHGYQQQTYDNQWYKQYLGGPVTFQSSLSQPQGFLQAPLGAQLGQVQGSVSHQSGHPPGSSYSSGGGQYPSSLYSPPPPLHIVHSGSSSKTSCGLVFCLILSFAVGWIMV